MTTNRSLHLVALGLVSFIVFFIYRDHYVNGDALIYADNILRLRFVDISVHIGYYFVGYLSHLVLSQFGMTIDHSLILSSGLLGSIGVIYTYLLAERLVRDSSAAFLCSMIVFMSGAYLYYSTTAEVYVPQAVFTIASMYYFLVCRPVVSGILFAIAVLITPLTIFIAPFYLTITLQRKVFIKGLLYFAAAFAVVTVPVYVVIYDELLWGRRGLLNVALGTSFVSLNSCIRNFTLTCGKSFHLLAPFALLGYVCFYIKNKGQFLLLTIMVVSQFYLVIKAGDAFALETFLLPIFFFFSLMVSFGLNCSLTSLIRHLRLRKFILVILLACYAAISLFLRVGFDGVFAPKIVADSSYQNGLRTFDVSLSGNDILIANFRDGVAFTFYTRTEKTEELETTMGNERWFNVEYLDRATFQELLGLEGDVYVMESYSPSPGAALLLSGQRLAEKFARHSLKSKIESLSEGVTLSEHVRTDLMLIYKAEIATPGIP